MELKSGNASALRKRSGLNRTFMELKYQQPRTRATTQQVLIEPLWNWNKTRSARWRLSSCVLIEPLWNWNDRPGYKGRRHGSLNRTFMELKSRRRRQAMNDLTRLNRTFMELKYNYNEYCAKLMNVLIEPLWNWNNSKRLRTAWTQRVLIEPLWNWNRLMTRLTSLSKVS